MRSLYECGKAKVTTDGLMIHCLEGGFKPLPIAFMAQGVLLELEACQDCDKFKRIGPPVPEEERGWKDLPQQERKPLTSPMNPEYNKSRRVDG
jgi:hypothetical protein